MISFRLLASSMGAVALLLPLRALEGATPPGKAENSIRLDSYTLDFGAMGTEVTIEAYHADETIARNAVEAAVREIQRIEDLMTSWRPSPLVTMNAGAGAGPQAIHPEMARLIARSFAIAEASGGAFDPTYAGVGKLWNFKAKPPQLPTREQIEAALPFVDYRQVSLDLATNMIDLPKGFRIGLGGIAKGYGVDRAMKILMEHGIEHAIVNAGGDLKALGTKNGRPWRIAVRHPRHKQHTIAMVPLANVCMVTSGDYERFFELDGTRYHHILDPRTGYPAKGAMSATVIAPDAAYADGLATALTVMGAEKGMILIESLERVEAVLIDMDGKVHTSTGLAAPPR